ncbi:MAG: Crp/Fnr family transcriptional regulator [Rhizobiaceae bacterium]
MKPNPEINPADLARMELFQDVPETLLPEVAARARVRLLPKDTTIFVQGSPASHCHALIDGRVRISQSDENGTQLVVRFIGPGEMFGTVALFTDRKYPVDATAVVDCVELSWTETALHELMAQCPPIAVNMVKILGVRIREVQDRLREMATQRVERRIAHALLRLAAKSGLAAENGKTIDFPLTRKDVADLCGATLSTASRVLTGWEKAGYIQSKRQRVTLRDLEALQAIAEDRGENGLKAERAKN